MIEVFLYLILVIILGGLFGALVGLIPFMVGKYSGKPNLGRLGWRWCMGTGLLGGGPAVLVCIGFTIAILVRDADYYPAHKAAPSQGAYAHPPVSPQPVVNTHLGISCMTGPMKGQTYPIGADGIMIGRDHDCAIRFPSDQPGISRHHCSLRWQQGVLMLTDLGSAYGTYMADGRKLPPQYPTQVAAGTRFYLANTNQLFQIVITG